MSILGISCGGIDSACGGEDTRCNKKKKDEVGDFLDGLLDGLENGPLDYGQSVCDDARSYAPPELAGGIIFGGLPDVPLVVTIVPFILVLEMKIPQVDLPYRQEKLPQQILLQKQLLTKSKIPMSLRVI